MTDIKLICFDLDDTVWPVTPTLIKAELTFYQALQDLAPALCERYTPDMLRRQRQDFLKARPELRHNVSRWRLESLQSLLEETGHAQQSEDIARQAFAIFLQARQRVHPFANSEQTLAELAQSYHLIALTNGNADVTRMPIGQYFRGAYRAEEIGLSKPHPALFEKALADAGCAPGQAVHVGDNLEDDIAGAKRVGLLAVQARLTETAWPPSPEADDHFDDWRQLPGIIAALSRRQGD
ncbi:HAD-IA family hydrolase [Spongiibacter taiwanensis]|uniref:HAD family hydrolase n=1 Tax=Spongiibacter taiwanensis TaxID=1748242 RepID=UPI002035E3C6|nr:HAD-IA family hydrolase [Spongiibacter taiwanensis]USA44737.1 HAD-IA family hydrolase [Spongiibacter taiwanensis]